MTGSNGLFLSWAKENGRTRDLAPLLGLEPRFIHPGAPGGLLIRYLRQFAETLRMLRRCAPRAVVIMLPPFPLLLAAALYVRRSGIPFVADLHTGFFNDPRWSWATGMSMRLLRSAGAAVVVTNERLARQCRAAGLREVVVLHDVLEERTPAAPGRSSSTIVCPVRYANDEPITEVLEAARRTPDLQWVLTATPPRRVRERAPRNVRFPGFLPDDDFEALLGEAAVILALTTKPFTMQRAGYEGLMRCKPLVLSESDVLVEFFQDAAVFVQPVAASIASGVRNALARAGALSAQAERVLGMRIAEQQEALGVLQRILVPARAGQEAGRAAR